MTVRALVRRPGRELAHCQLTHLERAPIDVARALDQHAAFVAALESLGVSVTNLPPLANHPDACFVEDPAVALDDIVLLTRPGAASRRGEVDSLEAALAGVRPTLRMREGTLDGGDVLRMGDRLFVGRSTRTDAAGVAALTAAAAPRGLTVEAVDVPGALHLKTAVTWLGGDTLLANPAWVDLAPFDGMRTIEVDSTEPFGANALRVGDRLLLSTAAPRTNERVASAGFDVTAIDVSEFHRAEAGLTCLSLLLD